MLPLVCAAHARRTTGDAGCAARQYRATPAKMAPTPVGAPRFDFSRHLRRRAHDSIKRSRAWGIFSRPGPPDPPTERPLPLPKERIDAAVSTELEQIWSRVQSRLEAAVDDSTYRVWLAPCDRVKSPAERSTVEAPGRSCAWVRERFGRLLQTCAATVLGPEATVEIIPSPPQPPVPVGRHPHSIYSSLFASPWRQENPQHRRPSREIDRSRPRIPALTRRAAIRGSASSTSSSETPTAWPTPPH